AAGAHRPLLLSSLRDILTTGHRDQVGHDERACTLANRYLDAILVHADPHFARLEDSFHPEQDLRVPVFYTGFVVPPGTARRVGQPVRLQAGARRGAGARTRAGRAVQRAGQGRAVGPGPTARAARSGARARTRTARRADARRRGARVARLSAVAARARPRRGAAYGRPPGRDARGDASRRGGRRAAGWRRAGPLTGAIPDLARVRAFLRHWCDAEVALDRLEVSHLSVGPDGPRRALYEGPGPGGQMLRLIAQRMEAGEGRRLEAELNHLWPGAPAGA